jgi:hypothetical protein
VFDTLIRARLAPAPTRLDDEGVYLVPPMDDEPPPEFVAFVSDHLSALRQEVDRLVGGDPEGGHIYLEVLADVAGHWRRLHWRARLTGRDATTDYLQKRLAARTREWRDDQIYDVDIGVVRQHALVPGGGAARSMALRKAKVLEGTVRSSAIPYADAGIAWVHAYRRQEWHRIGRWVVGAILLIGGMIQYMTVLSADY